MRRARARGRLCWWKIALFAVCFAVVFGACQRVIVKFFPLEELITRNQTYFSLPENTVDVLFLGTSKLNHGISPNVLWNEAGIASFNMTGTAEFYTLVEQNLLAALEMNTAPKYAVFIPKLLYYDGLQHVPLSIQCYKAGNAMPRLYQRARMLFACCRDLRDQPNRAGWLESILPFFQLHHRWTKVTWEDFLNDGAHEETNPPYCLGQSIYLSHMDVTKAYQNPSYLPNEELTDYGQKAWSRIFERCKKVGVTPVVVNTPCFEEVANDTLRRKCKAFYERYGVIVYDYDTDEEKARMNWDYRRDFYNETHLNLAGGAKLSADLAQKLSQLPGIEDHRGDERFAVWDEYCDTYYDNFQDELTYALGEEGARRYNQ